MKPLTNRRRLFRVHESRTRLLAASAALLVAITSGLAFGLIPRPILPPGANAYGNSYGGWSAEWWKFEIEMPIDPAACPDLHPFFDTTGACVSLGQSGKVWFVTAPLSTPLEREYTVPRGISLFIALPTTECSSVEPVPFFGSTEAEQRACANLWGDSIQAVFFEIDGVPIQNIAAHRAESPQFTFTAPENNILGVPGGSEGTAVADGYYVQVVPYRRASTLFITVGSSLTAPSETSLPTSRITLPSSKSFP